MPNLDDWRVEQDVPVEQFAPLPGVAVNPRNGVLLRMDNRVSLGIEALQVAAFVGVTRSVAGTGSAINMEAPNMLVAIVTHKDIDMKSFVVEFHDG
jgi:hypothetical protein